MVVLSNSEPHGLQIKTGGDLEFSSMDLVKALHKVSHTTGRSNGEGTGVLGVFWPHSLYRVQGR